MRGRTEDQSMRGGEKIMGRKRGSRRGKRQLLVYMCCNLQIDMSVAMETNKDMSHGLQH